MKKMIAVILSLLFVLSALSGCSGGQAGNKVLTVATSPDFAPMAFVSADENATGNDKYVGFDMLLAQYLADEMGMELEIKPMSFDACQTAVSLGAVDMAISGFSWKEDRAENYNLSDYYWAGDNEDEQILITLAGNEGKYDSLEKLSGVKVGAQIASLQQSLCQEQLTDSEIVVVTDLTTALMQLRNGDFDVLAVAGGYADAMMINNSDIIKTGFCFEVDPKYTGNVILMTKGEDELTATVNALLAKAEAAGYYDIWYAQAKSTAGIQVVYDEEGNAVETLP
ncbi:MAG: transporter substrate-binding domain-containing protein [Ruminococcaceae bacterium]|nr:transporter substrate-binding domain-containing protein [Oscillospiraceae bacterium]